MRQIAKHRCPGYKTLKFQSIYAMIVKIFANSSVDYFIKNNHILLNDPTLAF
jgi:hypothetical protein